MMHCAASASLAVCSGTKPFDGTHNCQPGHPFDGLRNNVMSMDTQASKKITTRVGSHRCFASSKTKLREENYRSFCNFQRNETLRAMCELSKAVAILADMSYPSDDTHLP